MFNNCWVAGGGEFLGYACYGGIPMTMTSYTKRCRRSRRVCWCKFGWNPTSSFSVICDLVSLSLIPRQGVILVFACLFIYSLTRGLELFACLSIYENAETLSQRPGRPRPYVCPSSLSGSKRNILETIVSSVWLWRGVCEGRVRGWVGLVWLGRKEESSVVGWTVGGRLIVCTRSEVKFLGAVLKVPWQNKNQPEREFLENQLVCPVFCLCVCVTLFY